MFSIHLCRTSDPQSVGENNNYHPKTHHRNQGTLMFEREALYKRPAEIISADRYQSSSMLLMKFGWNSTFGKRKRGMSMDVKSLPVFLGPPRGLQRPIKIGLVHVGKVSSEPIFTDKPFPKFRSSTLDYERRTLANCVGNKHTSQEIKPIVVGSRRTGHIRQHLTV